MFEGAPGVPDHPLQRVLSEVKVCRAVYLAPGQRDLVTRGVVVDARCVSLTPPVNQHLIVFLAVMVTVS